QVGPRAGAASSRPATTFDATRSVRRPQTCGQPVERPGNHAPVVEPIAREAHRDVGPFDAPLIVARAGHGARTVGAAYEKTRPSGLIDQVLACVRRGVPECEHGKPI